MKALLAQGTCVEFWLAHRSCEFLVMVVAARIAFLRRKVADGFPVSVHFTCSVHTGRQKVKVLVGSEIAHGHRCDRGSVLPHFVLVRMVVCLLLL